MSTSILPADQRILSGLTRQLELWAGYLDLLLIECASPAPDERSIVRARQLRRMYISQLAALQGYPPVIDSLYTVRPALKHRLSQATIALIEADLAAGVIRWSAQAGPRPLSNN